MVCRKYPFPKKSRFVMMIVVVMIAGMGIVPGR